MNLPSLPVAPPHVKYALTVPQSVLFADLSLRGSRADVFRRVLGIDYAPGYIAIDRGAMSWDFSAHDPFVAVLGDADPVRVTQAFITLMGRTSRGLERATAVVAAPVRRRPGHPEDLLEDLTVFWDAYEAHMTSLFTFWNVENLLTDSLTDLLRTEGLTAEIESGLARFIRPSESNWFSLEQNELLTLRGRFADGGAPEAIDAADRHAQLFGFLVAPFNLGAPPTAQDIRDRMLALRATPTADYSEPPISEFPADVNRLGNLERELSYWKTERLDCFARADAAAHAMYAESAALLGAPLPDVFNLTRDELTGALTGSKVDVAGARERGTDFCLALVDGEIAFFHSEPKEAAHDAGVVASGDVLVGRATSPGTVRGRVRLVEPGEVPALANDEILVTLMTRPDMGAALDVALAYVTEEGGRLSHAAIVSREKGKPCVTAVPDVTSLLRQGMFIEVDGDKGTVRVIDASFIDERA